MSDVTEMGDVEVRIAGVFLISDSIIFAWPARGCEHAHVIFGGESYVALAEGPAERVLGS